AARLGIDPEEIISHIHTNIEKYGLPNGMFEFGGGGLENSAAVPATVNEMLLQSYENVIRLFPCWKKDEDASFNSLRAYGAFLVSAKIEKGEIFAEIISEKGRNLRIERPEDGYVAKINGKTIPLTEKITEIKTAPGDTVTVKKTD
ncbi:MAG: trehalose hydrolase, partial [Clostridia bacterium]|nr:trehalose hydrolase [Clostridia bacterium]